MKKVWILERFETKEMLEESLVRLQDLIKDIEANDEVVKEVEKIIAHTKDLITENPDGRWHGIDGKSIYSQFCNVAKSTIRTFPEQKFRVVEAEIEDDAQYWLGYKFVKENDGVLRYLMATLNKC